MNITLTGKKITQDERILAFKKDNLTAQMTFTVDTDDSWVYKLDVRLPEKCCTGEELFNIIDLPMDANRTCTIDVTAAMVPLTGKYTMQLRGISGEQVYHSDTFEVWVKYSIDPGVAYDPVPSEFYQIEQNITEINNHPPYPDISGFWMIWNSQTNKYELSDIPAVTASDIGAIPVPTTAEVGQTIVVKAVDENGKPTEWEPVTLPKQVQSDWNQNNSSAVDYVKNRPFYEIHSEKTVENVTSSELDGFPVFTVGDTVTVKVDGVEYSLVAYDDDGFVTVGDTSNDLENGTGQYGWQIYVEDNICIFFSNDSRTVCYNAEIIQYIDEKYLRNTTNMYSFGSGELIHSFFIPDVDSNVGTAGIVRRSGVYLQVNECSLLPNMFMYSGGSIHNNVSLENTSITLYWNIHTLDGAIKTNSEIIFGFSTTNNEYFRVPLTITSKSTDTVFTATGSFVTNSGALYTVVYSQSDGNSMGQMVITKL